jgi:hypothetical protein
MYSQVDAERGVAEAGDSLGPPLTPKDTAREWPRGWWERLVVDFPGLKMPYEGQLSGRAA